MKRLAALLRRLPLRGRPMLFVDRIATRLDRASVKVLPPAQDEIAEIVRQRARRLVPVDQPMVLITQIHRSGGTLLMRLFDGHPQVHAIPHELGSLMPAERVPSDADAAWAVLHDPKLDGRFRRGLRQQKRGLNQDESDVGFLLVPTVHRALFDRRVARADGERAVMNAYLTAYFNAWLDYGGLRGDKAWVTGFESAMIAQPKRMARFRELYPDGRVISIVREPAGWFASARRWDPRYERIDVALALWEQAALAAEAHADVVLDFDDLTERPAETMAALAACLGIEPSDELLVPTANGVPFGPNSSFESDGGWAVQSRAGRGGLLSDEERGIVEQRAAAVYHRVRDRRLPFGA